MRLFAIVLIAGCSAPAPPPAPPRHVPAPAPDLTPIDAAPIAKLRGEACGPVACADGLTCLPLAGGYCASTCAACPTGGGCTETWRAGELCLASCTTTADCRAAEGYVCDPTWKTCMLPNQAAIVPRSCPAAGARDPSFGAVEALSAPPGYQYEPSAVVADDGVITAMFVARGNEGSVLGISRNATLRSDRAEEVEPWLAREASGAIDAVWLGEDGTSRQAIEFATSSDRGATWSPPIAVHDPGDCDGEGCLDKPMVFAGADPRKRGAEILYVMYASGAGLRVRASRDRGQTFGKPVTPLAGSHGDAAIGSDGRLHVVALSGGPLGSYGSADAQIDYAVSADGGASFTRPLAISKREEMLPYFFANPSIVVDDRRGWIYIAYTRGGRDAIWDLVISASKDRGKTWHRTRIGDDPPCAIHMVPNLALDPTTGTLHVAWYDNRGGGRFAHAACPAGATTCTQLGAISDTPFTLSTARLGSTWLGEYESLVVDDKRRVLHAVWTQPAPVSQIFHATAKLR